ncbi:MAG: Smr/MutS family protein, partial [Chloroflexota bacterium]|nr:Smr/MutS family protein [Chloroflexota bacterium]
SELLLIQDTLGASRIVRRAFLRLPDYGTRFPSLVEFVEYLTDQSDLEALIDRSVGPRGDVLDTASPELGRIRRAVRVAQNRLMDRLNSLISGGRYAGAIQDAIVTMRDGRYVVPVKAEARGQLPGVVHGTSASGQTLFVEPLDVVELNNRWREQQAAEQHEIDRILDALSESVSAQAEPLASIVEALAAIDLAMAKGRLAFRMRAERPILWSSPPSGANDLGHTTLRIALYQARHPLLDPATVVPIDVEIGSDYRVLLITGPNTGGKTVALKMVGLLTLMAQAGLFIPAEERSIVSVFPRLFVDIGDEQSIAQSLSTFSGHVKNIIAMLREVTPDSLVLLDELGAGTDPQEGSALARALISELLGRQAMVLATTHYSEVKAYAYATPGVENASVEFDVKSLAPTYRLMIGVPGRSNAIAIARRLGLPQTIVDAATEYLDPNEIRADALLGDIRLRRDAAEQVMERTRQAEAAALELKARAERILREAENERRDARAEALAEAEVELSAVRDALRQLERDRSLVAATRQLVQGRKEDVHLAAETVRAFRQALVSRPAAATGQRPLGVGDRVFLHSLGQEGDVISLDEGTAEIQIGTLKTRVPVATLERRGRTVSPIADRGVYYGSPGATFVPIEIDLRGHRAAEISDMLETYITDAYNSGLPTIRIIHGKG